MITKIIIKVELPELSELSELSNVYLIIITSIGYRFKIILFSFCSKVPKPNSLITLHFFNKFISNISFVLSKLTITI